MEAPKPPLSPEQEALMLKALTVVGMARAETAPWFRSTCKTLYTDDRLIAMTPKYHDLLTPLSDPAGFHIYFPYAPYTDPSNQWEIRIGYRKRILQGILAAKTYESSIWKYINNYPADPYGFMHERDRPAQVTIYGLPRLLIFNERQHLRRGTLGPTT